MGIPLIAIITPTQPGREDLLLNRCIPSVEAQRGNGTRFQIRHIIVSDFNPELMKHLEGSERVYRVEPFSLSPDWTHYNPTWKRAPGAYPYHLGALIASDPAKLEAAGFGVPGPVVQRLIGLASQTFAIGYLGDDDEYLPNHVGACLYALRSRNIDLVISKGDFRLTDLDAEGRPVIGEDGKPVTSHVIDVGSGRIENGQLDTNGIFHRRIALEQIGRDGKVAVPARNIIAEISNWRVPSPNPNISDLTLVRDLCVRDAETPVDLRSVPPITWGFLDRVTYRHYDGGMANGTVNFGDPLGRRDEYGRPLRLRARDWMALRDAQANTQPCPICGQAACPGHPGWDVVEDAPPSVRPTAYVQHPGSPDGGLAPEELAALVEFAKDARILEIGTQHGFSTIQMAKVAEMVDTVDWHRGLGDDDTLGAFWQNTRAADLERKVIAHVGRAEDVLPRLGYPFDLVYVDGGHSYEEALFDLTQARRLVKPGGIVAAHDYGNDDWPGVAQAWHEIFGPTQPEVIGVTLAIWRSPSPPLVELPSEVVTQEA